MAAPHIGVLLPARIETRFIKPPEDPPSGRQHVEAQNRGHSR